MSNSYGFMPNPPGGQSAERADVPRSPLEHPASDAERGPRGEVHPSISALRAFFALVWFSVRRQGRVRQVAWVGFALLGVTALVVGVVSNGGRQWRPETERRAIQQFKPRVLGEEREARQAVVGPAAVAMDEESAPGSVRMTYEQYARERMPLHMMLAVGPDEFAVKMAYHGVFGNLMAGKEKPDRPDDDPDYGNVKLLVQLRDAAAFTNFCRWVVFTLYLAFLLPLFTLAYATGAIGAEREGRTLLWLITRPLPRWAVYVAKLLGMLPWCVGVSGFAFAVLAVAGGDQGRKALGVFWPQVLIGAVAFGCVFHMVGALFRRPTIVGLVYVFFFETLVANLPGGLKQFSLNYYLKSLFYNRLTALTSVPDESDPLKFYGVRPEGLDTYQAAEPSTAWVVLILVSVAVTALGAWLFGRQEPKDET